MVNNFFNDAYEFTVTHAKKISEIYDINMNFLK